jgi:hypothetical protein
MLRWKKSKSFYAEKLGISEKEIEKLLKVLKNDDEEDVNEVGDYIDELEDQVVKYVEDVKSGTGEIVYNSSEEIRTLDDLVERCNIDTSKWNIDKYIQNYWGSGKTPHWQVKAWMSVKKEENVFQDRFIDFLSTYKPHSKKINSPNKSERPLACLIINKQDAHLNKHDIEDNDSIEWRGSEIEQKVLTILSQARLSNDLMSITYVIGSDEFNSEWTNATTKGTPQQNTDDYQKAFEEICYHEIDMITLLLSNADYVNVIYVPGNHDEYVGWHLIKWLEAYFRDAVEEERISFDSNTNYRKYHVFGSTAMMFNHGDAIKPSKLASIFPMEFKESWSEYDHFYIFTGDKHHELSQDFNGIKFYQIPAFSNAKSKWDDKNGYTCSKGEVTAFLIEHGQGMTNIFKQYL